MTLKDQINLELDDVYLDVIEKEVQKIYPELALNKEVPKNLIEPVSEILYTYAK